MSYHETDTSSCSWYILHEASFPSFELSACAGSPKLHQIRSPIPSFLPPPPLSISPWPVRQLADLERAGGSQSIGMGPLQISYPSVEFQNQLRDGVAPIEACAFNAPRCEFLAVDASALRVWGLRRVIKTIMAPSTVRYTVYTPGGRFSVGPEEVVFSMSKHERYSFNMLV